MILDDFESPEVTCHQLVIGETAIECESFKGGHAYDVSGVLTDHAGKIYELQKSDDGKLHFKGDGLTFDEEYLIKTGKRVTKIFLRGSSNSIIMMFRFGFENLKAQFSMLPGRNICLLVLMCSIRTIMLL